MCFSCSHCSLSCRLSLAPLFAWSLQHGAETPEPPPENANSEPVVEVEGVEEIVESPKERAKRVKREAKEAAAKAKAEAKRQQAEAKEAQAKQRAIEKVRRRVCHGGRGGECAHVMHGSCMTIDPSILM